MSRAGWAVRSGVAVMVAVLVTVTLLAIAVAIGTSAQGHDWVEPASGVFVLGLYGMALAGIGLAVGGLIRSSLAAPVTLILGLGMYLLDVIGTILDLPDEILDLALNRHLGRPMLGDYDETGLVLLAGLTIGGVALSAIGLRRRDVGR